MRRALVAAVLVVLAGAARAESPRWGSFELAAGKYRPDIDSEFTTARPFQTAFGGDGGWLFRAGVAKAIFTGMGSLEIGLQAGYLQQTGRGEFVTGGRSGDETAFKMVPVSLGLTYRFDLLADRHGIPLAPYARASLERYHWWVTDGEDDTSEEGATNGWSVAAGIAFLLDVLDRQMARELDLDTGVNHTYLFFEVKNAVVDDFGSGRSWDLSDENLSYAGGLLFVF
jgi:hypothetical protein